MSRPLAGPSPLPGPSPLTGPSPRPLSGPSPRPGPGPSPIARARGLPSSTPTRTSSTLPSGSPSVPSKRSASISMPGPGKEKKAKLAPGNAWIAGQVAAMEVQYKNALVAATMILQFQADSKAIGYKSRPPTRLQTRLTAAWRNYDAIRRHVEWYISQNVEYAAAPDKFAARRPAPLAPQLLPTPSPASAVPAHMQHTPAAASPVPLSSGFLSKPDPAAVDNIFEGMSIEGMSMDELNAFIGGSDFAQVPQVAAAVQQQPEDAMTPTSKLFASLNASNSPKVSPTQQTQPTPSQPPAPPPPPAMPAGGDDDFDFSNVDLSNIDLTAFDGIFDADGGAGGGAGTGDAGTNTTNAAGVTSVPTNTSALASSSAFNFEAFLNSGDGAGNAAGQSQLQTPSQPMEAAPGQAPVSAPQPEPPAPQPEPSAPQPPLQQPIQPPLQQPIQPPQLPPQPQQPPAQPAPVPAPAPAQPAPPPVPVLPAAPQDSFDSGEFGDIDFDGFNFDDMPDVNGDEFASLLAEFK
ncbi:uncharacterized protein CcaverHIS019_0510410 [Cutaneotrichosporon cavernicola]|uniref:Uncharacterized protein n=1 Tax=Cutaneotrichosporon cavernicola TaxID=279322 RepID=A0AA48L7J9_9TREE|nr:uncharacterized protein CcaverHIS019_0510410 [Cutaneotrichosporon cavernicola]BEI93413.1 hypothetical protein CcaverHIS019_0510410 [Cutaneotrichosporon cavernicola]